MRLRTIITAGLILVLTVLLWSLRTPTPKERPLPAISAAHGVSAQVSPQNQSPQQEDISRAIHRVLAAPITFYGRVIDQHGEPVPDATVNYGALDRFDAPGSHYEGKSDTNGTLSINGIAGAVLNVGVRKEGYYMVDGKSAHVFAYGVGPDSTRRPPPSRENPAIFLLHKMGVTEPLITFSSGGIEVPKNGTPVSIDLATGKKSKSSANCLKVEVWTKDETAQAGRSYDWRCRISVPGGGLLERKEQFDFQAPIDGYQEQDEIVMKSSDLSWRKRFKKSYFARLPSGRYGRFQFEFTSGGDHFFMVESFLNPSPGSRNLEFDPKKVVKPLPDPALEQH